jgi:hypothetical protein
MAVRLRTRWHRSSRSERNRVGSARPKSRASLASVVAVNIWKLAKEGFTRMEKQGFRFRADSQAIDVIAEFCIFMLHITDRMIYGRLPEAERAALINDIAMNLAHTIEANQQDLLGPGDYLPGFIDKLNRRLGDYAECGYHDTEGPAIDFKRYLARNVADIMAATDDKWVLEQVLEVEAPEVVQRVRPMVRDVLGLTQTG